MNEVIKEKVENTIRISVIEYILVVLFFSVPMLIVGYYVVKDN